MDCKNLKRIAIAAVLLVACYYIVDRILFNGVRPVTVSEDGLVANYYSTNESPNPAIILIGGGMWGEYWASELAMSGYPSLSLTYSGAEGLPELPEEIPLEYFEKAAKWLSSQPTVDPEHIVVMGASKNAELALVIASYLNEEIHGCIAFAPSSVSWSNTVLPYNSDEIKPSWTYGNAPVPFIAMQKLQPGTTDTLETLSYWQRALADSSAVAQAAIPVERIQGPILLFSGLDDQVWPSAQMGQMIETRIARNQFAHPIKHFVYDSSGHFISGNPLYLATTLYGQMQIQGANYYFGYGGTPEGDQKAQLDAKSKVFEYFKNISNE